MTFTPHLILKLKEAAFVKYIESLEENTAKEGFSGELPSIKLIDNKTPLQPDAVNKELIHLYDLLTQFVQKSRDLKMLGRNPDAAASSNGYLQDLGELAVEVHRHFYSLKSQPILWEYLLNNKQGRLVFYYLIYLNLIHQDRLKLASSTDELFNALLEQGCSDPTERLALQFLRFRFDIITNKSARALIILDPRVGNPFINAFRLFQSLEELPSTNEKLEVVQTLNDKPLSFSQATPAFIIQFIQLQYVSLFVVNMGCEETALQQIDAAKKLSTLGYFPALVQQINGTTPLHCLRYVIDMVYLTYRAMYSFSLFNDFALIFRKWHSDLMFFQVFMYYRMMHFSSKEERRVFKATLNERDLLASLTSALNLIKIQQHVHVSKDPQEIAWNNLFWSAAKSLFCPEVLVQPDFVHTFKENIHLIIAAFLNQDRLEDLCDILAALIEYQDLFHHLKPNEYTLYFNITMLLQFIRDVSGSLNNKPQEAFTKLLEPANAHRIYNEIKTVHPELPGKMRALFFSKLALFTQNGDKSNTHYSLLQKVADFLKLPKHEFDTACPFHVQDIDWSDEEWAEPKDKPTKKKAKKIFAAAAPAPKFFKSPVVDPSKISRDALPQAIWDFADFIYEHTKKELILGGSAAAFLYLKKEGNPRDYDFILLNIPRADLLNLLLEQGGYKVQLVGKQVPIIKLQLESASGPLDLDINIEMNDELDEPLTKTMEGILAKRDFKVSALYMVLQQGRKHLEVKGYDKAIHSLNAGVISVVNHKYDLFNEDPIRLFRLVKNCLQYPNFRFDNELQGILRKINIKDCFDSYLKHLELIRINTGKISTAIETLLARFEISSVLNKMDELGIFSGLFNLNYEDIKENLHLLEPYNVQDAYAKKRALNLFLHIHYIVKHADIQKLNAWTFYGVARCIKPADQMLFNQVESALLNMRFKTAPPEGELRDWITHIQNAHVDAVQERRLG